MKIQSMRTSLMAILGAVFLLSGCADKFTQPTSPSGNTVAQVATGIDSLKAFNAALTKTGLTANFGNINAGQFTIFAPSSYSFVKYLRAAGISIGKVDATNAGDSAVKAINKLTYVSTPISIPQLATRLNYHIISTGITSSQITGAQGFTTMNGARLSLSHVSGATYPYQVNANTASNGANIIDADKSAANGVVHVIDKVIAPISVATIWDKTLLNFSVNYSVAPIAVTMTSGANTVTIARDNSNNFNISNAPTDAVDGNYNLFSAAIVRANLASTISPNLTVLPDFTVFAPTDAAMKAYLNVANEAAGITMINSMSVTSLASLVNYHIVSGRILSTDLVAGSAVTTLTTDTFTVDGSLNILDKHNAGLPQGSQVLVPITGKDKLTNAGIVHVIGGVLSAN